MTLVINNCPLCQLQNELDSIYEEKTRVAFIRSRRKWMENGIYVIIIYLKLNLPVVLLRDLIFVKALVSDVQSLFFKFLLVMQVMVIHIKMANFRRI